MRRCWSRRPGGTSGTEVPRSFRLPSAPADTTVWRLSDAGPRSAYDGGLAAAAAPLLLLTPTGPVASASATAAPGTVELFAGDGAYSESRGEGVAATAGHLGWPRGLAHDPAGNVYVADGSWPRVLRVDGAGVLTALPTVSTAAGTLVTVLGTGVAAPTVPGPAAATGVSPSALDVLPDDTVRVADAAAARVWTVHRGSAPGVLGLVAGTGLRGDDVSACSAPLACPTGLARAADGTVHVADYRHHRVRRTSPAGIITTVAGSGQWGPSGDGGPATLAQLAGPHGVAVGPDGALWIADTGNARLRRVDPVTGVITTCAGTSQAGAGVPGGDGDIGPAVTAQLGAPRGCASRRAWRCSPTAGCRSPTAGTTG